MTLEDAAGQFSWTGVLEEGGIVFTVSEDSEWPCYGAGGEEGKLKYFSEATDEDITIKINQTGDYQVAADLINLTYTVKYAPAPIPDILYITGDVIQPRSFFGEERIQSTEVKMQNPECHARREIHNRQDKDRQGSAGKPGRLLRIQHFQTSFPGIQQKHCMGEPQG